MANFDDAFFDNAFFDEAQPTTTPMAKVKLEQSTLDDDGFRDFVEGHIISITGKPEFPDPDPTPAVFDAASDTYKADLLEVTTLENALKEAVRKKNESRAALEALMKLRGAYVQKASGGVASAITGVGLGVVSPKTPTTTLAQVQSLVAKAGRNEGEAALEWKGKSKGTRGFTIEVREDVAGSAWILAKSTTKTKATVPGLTSGKRYLFRVRATGPGELVGPWSDEAQARVP